MVHFDAATHTYCDDNGENLLCVSEILRINGISPNYSAVPKEMLAQSAEFGTKIHADFNRFLVSDGTDDSADEYVMDFSDKFYHDLSEVKSEVIVYTDGSAPLAYAGTADIICKRNGRWLVADLKTTSSVHTDSVRWQTALYAYAYGRQNAIPYEEFDFACIHARNNQCKWVDLLPVRKEEVEDLLFCTANNIPKPTKTIVPSDLSDRAIAIQEAISDLKNQIKALEGEDKKIRESLLEFMKSEGATKLEFGKVKVSYIAPTTRTTVDSEKLKTYYPQAYESCQKVSEVKETIRITIAK